MFWPFIQNVGNHSIKLKFFFCIKMNIFYDTLALIDCLSLNIDKIKYFWNFGLFWPLLDFIGLYGLFWPLMIFQGQNWGSYVRIRCNWCTFYTQILKTVFKSESPIRFTVEICFKFLRKSYDLKIDNLWAMMKALLRTTFSEFESLVQFFDAEK